MRVAYIYIYKILHPVLVNSQITNAKYITVTEHGGISITYVFTNHPISSDNINRISKAETEASKLYYRPSYFKYYGKIKRDEAENLKLKNTINSAYFGKPISVFHKNCNSDSIYSFLACKLFVDGKL